MKLEGEVTSRDVLARTVARQIGSDAVVVQDPYVYVKREDFFLRFAIPDDTRLVLEALDRGEDVTEPICMRLVPPSELEEE